MATLTIKVAPQGSRFWKKWRIYGWACLVQLNRCSMISAIEFKNSDDIITKDHIINSLLTTSNLNDYINPFDKDKNYRIDSKDGDDTINSGDGNDWQWK